MSLTDDARLVVEIKNHPDWAELTDWGKASVRLAKAVLDANEAVEGGCPWCGEDTCGSCLRPSGKWARGSDCYNRQIARLTAKLATASSDLADHQQRLMRQSAELNAVRQERDELKRKAGCE